MFAAGKSANTRILVVRLGAMGDVIHALPAAASLKHSHPGSHLTWMIEARWAPLLADNPFIDRVALVNRNSAAGLIESWRAIRSQCYDFAVDFQGLVKSALAASIARPERIFGFHYTQVRERTAALFYSNKIFTLSAHVVDRNLDLAAAAGAHTVLRTFPLPAGSPEGDLPPAGFVLASPLAGWGAKQWPLDYYGVLAASIYAEFGLPLVLNGPPGSPFPAMEATHPHFSGLPGLIDATRRAVAVVGVDSGPLHVAAALGKPGVAIFGPTDPNRNGPCGATIRVLRHPSAATTYKRGAANESMRLIGPEEVFEALRPLLRERSHPAGCLVR